MNRILLATVLSFCIASECCAQAASRISATLKPNVIIFLVDDMGWMDSGVYGSEYYETPNIDIFASQSMRFTDAYAHALCSASRGELVSADAD